MFIPLVCPGTDGTGGSPRLARWLVEVGAEVAAGAAVAEIEVDKLTLVVESPRAATVRRLLAEPFAELAAGEPMAVLGPAEGALPPELADLPVRRAAPYVPPRLDDDEIDLVEGEPRRLPAMRRVVARRMAQSHRSAPCFYLTTSVDMSGCMALRERLKGMGRRATYNDMVIKAAALVLRERPRFLEAFANGAIWPRVSVNIGFALATDDGLVVPVIRNADRKPLEEIALEVRELARLTRQNRLTPAHCAEGVFSVSNLGSFDIDHFVAVVNPGESAILAVGKIEPRPVAIDDAVAIRPMMNITISGDHRVVDGAEGARFNGLVKRKLEAPETLLERIR